MTSDMPDDKIDARADRVGAVDLFHVSTIALGDVPSSSWKGVTVVDSPDAIPSTAATRCSFVRSSRSISASMRPVVADPSGPNRDADAQQGDFHDGIDQAPGRNGCSLHDVVEAPGTSLEVGAHVSDERVLRRSRRELPTRHRGPGPSDPRDGTDRDTNRTREPRQTLLIVREVDLLER